MSKRAGIEQIQKLLSQGLITEQDVQRMAVYGVTTLSQEQLGLRLMDQQQEAQRKLAQKINEDMFGGEPAMGEREVLDLGWKAKDALHQALWDKIEDSVRSLIQKAEDKGITLKEMEPYEMLGGSNTMPTVWLGTYVFHVFKADMKRVYGGKQGEVRLGGCRVVEDTSLDNDTVVILCHGSASVACMLTGGAKNDWAHLTFTYGQKALEA